MIRTIKRGRSAALVITALTITAACIVLTMSACSKKNEGAGSDNKGDDMSPSDIVEAISKDVELPAYEIIPLDKTNFESFAFAPYDDEYHAVAADALVNITAHSVVVIKTDKGDGQDLAETIAINADPNKWLCVGSEIVNVAYTDDCVLLVMSEKATADALVNNFKTLAQEFENSEVNLLTAGNMRYEQ